jgi:hypothetical protein
MTDQVGGGQEGQSDEGQVVAVLDDVTLDVPEVIEICMYDLGPMV